jgi:hypothetical protein
LEGILKMSTATLNTRASKILEAQAVAELASEQQAEREQAIADLGRIEADARITLPPLVEAGRKARIRLERTNAAAAEAKAAHDQASRDLYVAESQLDRARDRVLATIEATADPRIDEFVEDLRRQITETGAAMRDLNCVSTRWEVRNPSPENIRHNQSCRARIESLNKACHEARALKRNPHADVQSEIARIRKSLPTIEG